MDGRLDRLDRLCRLLYGLSILRVGVALRNRGLGWSVRCRSNGRCGGDFGSRSRSGSDGKSLSPKLVVYNGTGNTMIIHRGELQEANRLIHQTLRGKEVRILEVTIVQGRKLVCLRRRVRSSAGLEIFIHILHSGAEYGDFLDEGLECTCMGCVSGPAPPFVLREILLILRHLLDPDVDQSLQFTPSQVCERGVLPELECLGGGIADIRSFQQVRPELQAFTKLLGKAGELVGGSERTQNDKDLLPLLEVSILDDVAQVVSDDRLEQSKVW